MSRPVEQLTDEEQVERAIALSLISEQEDEKRRMERYGTLPLGKPATTVGKPAATSLIARPRPQPRGAGPGPLAGDRRAATLDRPPSSPQPRRNVPPVPPRPGQQQHQPQPQHPSLLRNRPDPQVPPRPGTPEQGNSPPLMSFSPPINPKKMDIDSFDIRSLDPLHNATGSISHSLPQPSQQPPPPQAHQRYSHPPSQPRPIAQPPHAGTPPGQSQDMFSGRLNQQSSGGGYGSQVFGSSTSSSPSHNTMTTSITRSAPASPKKQLSLAPAPSPPPLSVPSISKGRSLTPTPPNLFPRPRDDPFFLKERSNFHKVPSDPNFSSTFRKCIDDTSVSLGQARDKLSPLATTPSTDIEDNGATAKTPSTSTGTGTGLTPPDGNQGDLMFFIDDSLNEQEMSLESFDPLFVGTMSDSKHDSLGLFSNPFNKFERKETPNPFPDINAAETKKILDRLSPDKQPVYKHYDTLGEDLEVASSTSQKSSPEREQSLVPSEPQHELQDPFSMSELTASLELKRQRFAKEQEERRQLLCVPPSSGTTPSTTAQPAQPAQPAQTVDEEDAGAKAGGGGGSKEEAAEEDKKKSKFNRQPSAERASEESAYECLQRKEGTATDEIKAFCDMVARLKLQCPHSSGDNLGVIVASRLENPPYLRTNMSVKVVITARFLVEPFTFTPHLSSTIQHMIMEVLIALTDDIGNATAEDYRLKVHGQEEYLLNDSQLGEYAHVQQCLKLDVDIRLTMLESVRVNRTLIRTVDDDTTAVYVPKPFVDGQTVNRDKLNILMETYYKEVEKLRDNAINDGCRRLNIKGVEGSVKAIMAVLFRIETVHLSRALQRLRSVGKELTPSPLANRDSFVYVSEDGEIVQAAAPVSLVRQRSSTDNYALLDDLHLALEELTRAVKGLIETYCRAFHTDFRFESASRAQTEVRGVKDVDENFIVHIDSAHRLPLKCRNMFDEFRVVCGVYYGWRLLAPEITTQTRCTLGETFKESVLWDEWVTFESLVISELPRESQLVLQLIGVRSVTTSDGAMRVNSSLGTIAMQIFSHKFELVRGSQLVGLWPGNSAHTSGTNISNTDSPNSILMQINMPVFDFAVVFDQIVDPVVHEHLDFKSLHPNEQEQLIHLLNKDCITWLSPEEREYLWSRRDYLSQLPEALSKVLAGAPSWDWSTLRYIYPLVDEWAPLPALMALHLLLPRTADTFVRGQAVMWLGALPSDELSAYLPQLVQALKYESYHTSPLAQLLLQRAIHNTRLAHQLYWLLKEAADDVHYRKRYQLVFGALLSVVGENFRNDLSHQEDLAKMLAAIADKVKAARDKEKENVLGRELENMWDFLSHDAVRLPLDPSMLVKGVDVKSCSYFPSNASPLKLVLRNIDPKAEPIYVMFKSGDDLRQDMLTMQLIRIMDKLWLQGGLDLKIITFLCLSTGLNKGLVELVTESETLRKIQVKYGHGITGSFKDNTIQRWLTVQNPTELEYDKAVSNFTASCAGYCVATYVLGIGDRHNDNIMVKQSGHLFHIDFGKFLGDVQMFGNFKRDRSPFVLTSDMAYVINAGDKPSQCFQHFVDLCCQAFNILRHNTNLFLSLLSLMLHSGIKGLDERACRHVQTALMPHCTDAEATVAFTRMIEDSLKTTFTQLNFFVHNLAQSGSSRHTEGQLLSFIPKTYNIDQDGRVTSVEIFGFQKRYNPDKYYLYILRVDRENQKVPSFVFRRYSEFQELQHKLSIQFPLIRFPLLHNKVFLGRTHIKSVAEERKGEVEEFLRFLFKLAPEVSQHDLVYTFFHPMLRDEQDIDKANLQKCKEPSPPRPQVRTIEGQVKLSIQYKQDALHVMVMHVKDIAGLAGDPPDPYVKLYLLPDPMKITKRKTKILKSTFHPTFNEILQFQLPLQQVLTRHLQVSVWGSDSLRENEFLGAVILNLRDLDLVKETVAWFPLRNYPNFSHHA